MNIKGGMTKLAVGLGLFLVFAIGSVLIPILITHRRAEAMQKMIQPGMRWSEVAHILDLDRKWFFLMFRGSDLNCGTITTKDGKYSFWLPRNPGSSLTELKSLDDDLVLKQAVSCPKLSILYLASTSPERSVISVALSSGNVVSVGTVVSGD